MKTMRASNRAVWRRLLVGGCVAASAAAGTAPGELTLVRDGQPAAIIVLAEKPTRAAQFAAFELQGHLKAITGARLPIERVSRVACPVASDGRVRIYVGDGPRARALGLTQESFQLQEYALRSGSNELVLVGRDAPDFVEVKYDLTALDDPSRNANWPDFWEEQATLYAVHDFLRDVCGVRWFNATDTGTVIPRQPTLAVKVQDLRRAPTFRYRDAGLHAPEAYDRRVSLWGQQGEGFDAWAALAYADSRARQGAEAGATGRRLSAQLFLLRMRNGGELCRANHSLYHYYDLYWKPSKDPAAAKYFAGRRPELFAQGYEGDEPPQMCYTSTSLVAQVAQEARDYFDHGGYPFKVSLYNAPLGFKWGENYFCVEPMDNSAFCKCPACRQLLEKGRDYGAVDFFSKGIHSDYMFNFVNEVARAVKPTHPAKHIVTLAYGSHAWLPRDVKLDPSVAVQFCFASDGAPWSKAEYVHEWRLAQAWGKEARASGRPMYAWCYLGHMYRSFADNANFNCFPGFFAHAIGREMKMYKQLGYRGMYHCGLPPEVDAYVTFRLMDNADLDVDQLLDEYFAGLYGAAAEPMRKLYLAIEKTYSDPKLRLKDKNVVPTSVDAAWGILGTARRMAEFGRLLDQARTAAVTDREKRNVELFNLGTWTYMTQGRARYVTRKAAPIPAVSAPAVPDASGDATKVAWDKAAALGGGWFERGSDRPAPRRLGGRIAHDATYLYVELTDPCATTNLVVSPGVACYDDWELFVSAKRALPYRQFLVGPTGLVGAMLQGEVNWRMNVPYLEHGIRAASDTSAPDKWVTRLAIPLQEAVPGGAKPGDTIYLNVVRVSSPAVGGVGSFSIATWVSYTSVLEVDRSAEITLAP